MKVLRSALLAGAAVHALASSPALAAPATQPADASWRDAQPEVGPQPELTLPTFEKAVLPNGLTVLAGQLDRLPIVAFQLVTRGGAALDPSEQAGLGSLVYAMLEEGAGERDALEFSDAVADLGASFSTGGGKDRGAVTISGLSRHAGDLVSLLADAVRRPTFAPADLERRRAQTVASLQAQLGSPQGLAFLKLPALVYGEDHPLGHPSTGTLETIPTLDIEDVRAHHARLLAPTRSAFVAVGDVTLEEAVKLAKTHFGDWTVDDPLELDIPPVEPRERTAIYFIDKPKSPQTMAVLGRPLFGRGHPEEDALTLANAVWGGSFSSRLNMNLREDKGYTYGAGSRVSFGRGVGRFVAYAALQRAFSAPGLEEFFAELGRLEDEPISPDELERVKSGLVRSLPGDFERIGDLAGAAAQIFAYQLPLDHYAQLASRLSEVELEAVREAAGRYLEPEVMQVLMVGDAKTVVPALEAMDLGEVRMLTP